MSTIAYDPTHDLTDQLTGLRADDPLYAVRHHRDKVAAATQGSYDVLFDPARTDLSLAERLLVACYAARLTPAAQLLAHYQQRLHEAGVNATDIAIVTTGKPADAADPRLATMLEFTRKLIQAPVEGDAAALQTLPTAGIPTPAVVTLAQLVAFLSYQVRLLLGLKALHSALNTPAPTTPHDPEHSTTTSTAPRGTTDNTLGAVIQAHGFTNETLSWKAWLDVVDVAHATPEQIAVLEESHPKAKTSDYYLFLVHQPEILRQRSTAFNAIMYAPGGLTRAERELGATVVSRINGCVYCASVHAQRFEQLAKRNDVIAQVFENPTTAGTTTRERAIVDFSIQITQAPAEIHAASIHALQYAGLTPTEILDLLHSDAIFAWANRLMLNLGEPVFG